MVSRIGTLEIGTRIDSAGVTRGITAVSSAVSGFADGFRLATDAIQRLNMVSEELAQSQSIARSFNLSRESYERFALAVSASIGDIGEARDLLGDFQESVSLLARGEERELELFRELGFDIEFAEQAQRNLTGSFDEFVSRIAELDQVAARGVLTELVGADASRNILQLAQSYGTFAEALGRPLIFATDEAIESLNNLRVASEAAGVQLRESIVQALSDSGLADALANLITTFTALENDFMLSRRVFSDVAGVVRHLEIGILRTILTIEAFADSIGGAIRILDALPGIAGRLGRRIPSGGALDDSQAADLSARLAQALLELAMGAETATEEVQKEARAIETSTKSDGSNRS